MTDRRPEDTPDPQSRRDERAVIERIADAVEAAIDADTWAQATDILFDLSDMLRAELRRRPTVVS